MDDATTVRALLDAAQLRPPPEDVEALVREYPIVRGMADFLFTVEDARYESPALRFEPEPRVADWW